MKEKKSFVLYRNFGNLFRLLPMEERGILITAIFDYVEHGELPELMSQPTQMAFVMIRDTLDRDHQKYLAVCERNSINGKKGGRPKKSAAPVYEDDDAYDDDAYDDDAYDDEEAW